MSVRSKITVTRDKLKAKASALVQSVQKVESDLTEFVVMTAMAIRAELFESVDSALIESGITKQTNVRPNFEMMGRYVKSAMKFLAHFTPEELLKEDFTTSRTMYVASSAVKFKEQDDPTIDKRGLRKLLSNNSLESKDVKKATGQSTDPPKSPSKEGSSGGDEGDQANATVLLANANSVLRKQLEGGMNLGANEKKAIRSNIRSLIACLDITYLNQIKADCDKRILELEKERGLKQPTKAAATPPKSKRKPRTAVQQKLSDGKTVKVA